MSRAFPPRFPKQPWLMDAADLRPQGDPEIQVFTGKSILMGMHVRGIPEGQPLIAVRWEDGPQSLVIADGPITEAALEEPLTADNWDNED